MKGGTWQLSRITFVARLSPVTCVSVFRLAPGLVKVRDLVLRPCQRTATRVRVGNGGRLPLSSELADSVLVDIPRKCKSGVYTTLEVAAVAPVLEYKNSSRHCPAARGY